MTDEQSRPGASAGGTTPPLGARSGGPPHPPPDPAEAGSEADVLLLTVPADGAYLGVLRTAAAGLAARLHYTLDEIEDLRIAVDEACAMLIRLAKPAAELRCRFAVSDAELGVQVAVPASSPDALPPDSSFTWQVLGSLARDAAASMRDQTATVSLTARRYDAV